LLRDNQMNRAIIAHGSFCLRARLPSAQ